jgi:hypothetical protein
LGYQIWGMHKITEKEFSDLDLGDVRRDKRFVSILENIINHPGQSIPQRNKSVYDIKATYNFFSNDDIPLEKIQKAIHAYGATGVPAQQNCVLIPHDTSSISYNDLNVEGLGYLDHGAGNGIMLHSSMAVSTEGIPLSLLYQQLWARDKEELGKTKDRRTKPIEDKESSKWPKGIEACNKLLGDSITKVHIADREADIYGIFFTEPEANSELLIRAYRSRKITGNEFLWDNISNLSAADTIVLDIPDAKGYKKVPTKVEVRYSEVEILRPKHNQSKYESITLTAIEVRQPGIEDDEKGIWWKLLTTLEVKDIEDVKKYIRWYTYRWLIERFHYVIKSGCGIEDLQLRSVDALKKAIVMYCLAGFKIMQLTYQSRATPEISCEVILTKNEWQALYVTINKTGLLPSSPPTLEQATKWIGRLGGHLGRKSDGPPGLKTVWQGYLRLQDMAMMYQQLKKDLGND